MRNRTGFSLIEILITMAIFAIVAVSFTVIFVAIVNVQNHESSRTEVAQQSQFLAQQLQYYIEDARLVDLPLDTSATTLTLRMSSSSLDPTIITLASGTLYLQQGSGTPAQAITTSRVSVSSSSFTRHYNLGSSTGYGTESVAFSFVMSENTSNTKQEYSQGTQSSAAVLAPVPKIALLQQAKWESNSPTVTTLSASFGNMNETSSLLIALVANTGSAASVSIPPDSAGNTWTKIGSITYPAYNEEMNVFDAVNAVNASNTVTANFGSGASYASLFVYEYRGAATASSFDVTTSTLQPDTQTPSSGYVTPNYPIELLFGATYNASSTETPTPGSGFTLETASAVTHVFAEDMDQYITGAVAAGWQYLSTTPDSSALIVTFH
jgi:prepilin-type N-terminal cleavage/methylation domain-containing protein